MTESAHRLDQMGRRGNRRATSAGMKRANFEDLAGVTLPNGWKVLEHKYTFGGHEYWSFECSRGCGVTGTGEKSALKRRKGCGCKSITSSLPRVT